MSSKNLLIHLSPQQGYNQNFALGVYNMRLSQFGLLKLSAGTSYSADTAGHEVALVLLGGNFRAAGEGWEYTVQNGRSSPFTGKPHCLYLPRRTKYSITALSDVELACLSSPASRDAAKPTLIRPEDTVLLKWRRQFLAHLRSHTGRDFRLRAFLYRRRHDSLRQLVWLPAPSP